MRPIDADALKELFSEVIGSIAKKPEMNGNLEHMIRASAMVIQMIDDAPSIQLGTNLAEVGTDLVSRQAVKDIFTELYGISAIGSIFDKYEWADICETTANELPSAQPERPAGHWVEIGDEPYDEWECDVCGFAIDGSGCIDPEEYRDVYRFCPNCGADMRGEPNG